MREAIQVMLALKVMEGGMTVKEAQAKLHYLDIALQGRDIASMTIQELVDTITRYKVEKIR